MAKLPNPDDAFDVSKQDAIEQAVKQLSKEEAALFLFTLEMKLQKRKLQLVGYLVAMAVWLAGMLLALVIYGTSSGFVGWVFLMPFALVGLTLWIFGKWAEKVGKTPPPADLVEAVARKQK
ncbi:MAG TPA: hypothetical protein VIV11_28600 [Kofleriaceae bacterium]